MGNTGAQAATTAAQVAQTMASTQQIKAQIDKTHAETEGQRIDNYIRGLEAGAASGSQNDVPVNNRYQAALIARWESEVLGTRYTRETFADRVAQIQATLGGTISSARERDARTRLLGLDVPRAEAEANFYRSTYGKYSPFINNATDVLGKLTNIGLPIAKFRRFGKGIKDVEETTEYTKYGSHRFSRTTNR